jgi:hypothetical protein
VAKPMHSTDRPIYDIKPMQQRIADSTARARFTAILLTTSAAIAIVCCRHWNRDRSVGALAATRIRRTLLYEVKPSDPQTYLV